MIQPISLRGKSSIQCLTSPDWLNTKELPLERVYLKSLQSNIRLNWSLPNKNVGDVTALATVDGENLKEFNKDPIKSVLFSLGMENRPNGIEVAKIVHQHYFANEENKTLFEQYGEVKLFSDTLFGIDLIFTCWLS